MALLLSHPQPDSSIASAWLSSSVVHSWLHASRVPGVGSHPPFFFEVPPRGPAALLLATLVVCASEHHPICAISDYFVANSERPLVYFSVCSSARAQSRTVWVGAWCCNAFPEAEMQLWERNVWKGGSKFENGLPSPKMSSWLGWAGLLTGCQRARARGS